MKLVLSRSLVFSFLILLFLPSKSFADRGIQKQCASYFLTFSNFSVQDTKTLFLADPISLHKRVQFLYESLLIFDSWEVIKNSTNSQPLSSEDFRHYENYRHLVLTFLHVVLLKLSNLQSVDSVLKNKKIAEIENLIRSLADMGNGTEVEAYQQTFGYELKSNAYIEDLNTQLYRLFQPFLEPK